MSKIQITFDRKCKKFQNFLREHETFKQFENEILTQFRIIEVKIYFINKEKNLIPIEREEDFTRIIKENKGDVLEFFIDKNTTHCDSTANLKLDTRNFRYNYEYCDKRNDGKPWNLLVNLKKHRSIIKRTLKEFCGGDNRCIQGCTCKNNKRVIILENMLTEIKHFSKMRLKRKYWKSSKRFYQSNVKMEQEIA